MPSHSTQAPITPEQVMRLVMASDNHSALIKQLFKLEKQHRATIEKTASGFVTTPTLLQPITTLERSNVVGEEDFYTVQPINGEYLIDCTELQKNHRFLSEEIALLRIKCDDLSAIGCFQFAYENASKDVRNLAQNNQVSEQSQAHPLHAPRLAFTKQYFQNMQAELIGSYANDTIMLFACTTPTKESYSQGYALYGDNSMYLSYGLNSILDVMSKLYGFCETAKLFLYNNQQPENMLDIGVGSIVRLERFNNTNPSQYYQITQVGENISKQGNAIKLRCIAYDSLNNPITNAFLGSEIACIAKHVNGYLKVDSQQSLLLYNARLRVVEAVPR